MYGPIIVRGMRRRINNYMSTASTVYLMIVHVLLSSQPPSSGKPDPTFNQDNSDIMGG